MPHRDDLIGLLRSLDGTLRTLPPRAGHEARLRARLAAARPGEGRRAVRQLALAVCVIAALLGVWLSWGPRRAPEVAVQPAPLPSPSEVVREPRPSPSDSGSAAPRRAPSRRLITPALPVLPPHSELSPPSVPPPYFEAPSSPRVAPAPGRPAQASPPALADDAAPPRAGAAAPGSHPAAPFALAWNGSIGALGPARETPPATAGDARPGSSGGSGRGATSPEPAHQRPEPSADEAEEPAVNVGHDPDPNDPEAANVCEGTALDLDECTSAEELKLIAGKVCEAAGLSLAELWPALDCDGVDSTVAKLLCCGPGGPPAPGEGEGQACKTLSAGDGVTCVPTATLELQIAATCAMWKMDLAHAEALPGCGDGLTAYVKAECCTPAQASPEPFAGGAVGDGVTCRSNQDLAIEASKTCEGLGLTLLEVYTANDCGADSSRYAKYMCK